MKRKTVKAFSAEITLGMERGYDHIPVKKNEVIIFLQKYQDTLIRRKNIYLSASVTACEIVLSGQVEPHLKFGFINYPKFLMDHSRLKYEIETLVKALMKKFEQNRIVIEYLDETVMFERKKGIDSRIGSFI